MKICKNCRYLSITDIEKTEYWPARKEYFCHRENLHPVTGNMMLMFCIDERKSWDKELAHLHCGLDGKFFEEKDKE